MQNNRNCLKHSPYEVGDDEELYNAVNDTNGPALHNHWLGGFVGEKVCDTRPHLSSPGPLTKKKMLPLYVLCFWFKRNVANDQSSHRIFITSVCHVQRTVSRITSSCSKTEKCAQLFRWCSPPQALCIVTAQHPFLSLPPALSGSLTPHNDSSSCTSSPPPPSYALNIPQLQGRKWPLNVFTVFLV